MGRAEKLRLFYFKNRPALPFRTSGRPLTRISGRLPEPALSGLFQLGEVMSIVTNTGLLFYSCFKKSSIFSPTRSTSFFNRSISILLLTNAQINALQNIHTARKPIQNAVLFRASRSLWYVCKITANITTPMSAIMDRVSFVVIVLSLAKWPA